MYEKRIEELYSRHQSVVSAGFTSSAYKPGLDAMERFDRSVGSPAGRLCTVHVAGTNGKGSVSSMLATALAASGLKTGLYTSPHLVDFRERMKILQKTDGSACWAEEISREDVLEFLDRYEADAEGLSFFEITTGMAFWWFDRMKADVSVIEVGLGGRLDSTNIISPDIAIVTSIGLDHCQILGSTRAEIAGEKAGIFKSGTPALVWGHDDETDAVFERKAAECGCPLFFADDIIPDLPDAALDLNGPCQAANLRTVLAAMEILGVDPDMDALSRTSALSSFRGRWDKVHDHPETICDIGHNPPALRATFGRLADIMATGRKCALVYGVMADKDYSSNLCLIPEGLDAIYLCAPATQRSLPADKLHEEAARLRPGLPWKCCSSVARAVEEASADTAEDGLILICGSTFVVSEAIQNIEQ